MADRGKRTSRVIILIRLFMSMSLLCVLRVAVAYLVNIFGFFEIIREPLCARQVRDDDVPDDDIEIEDDDDDEEDADESSMGKPRRPRGLRDDHAGDSDDEVRATKPPRSDTGDDAATLGRKRKTMTGKQFEQAKQEAEERVRAKLDTPALRRQVVDLLLPGESVLTALKRLGAASRGVSASGASTVGGSKYGKARVRGGLLAGLASCGAREISVTHTRVCVSGSRCCSYTNKRPCGN